MVKSNVAARSTNFEEDIEEHHSINEKTGMQLNQ